MKEIANYAQHFLSTVQSPMALALVAVIQLSKVLAWPFKESM